MDGPTRGRGHDDRERRVGHGQRDRRRLRGPNPGTARTNGVIIAEQLVTIFQPERPGACVLAINPEQFSVSNAAQTVAFDVTITTGSPSFCSWSAGTLGELGFVHVVSPRASSTTPVTRAARPPISRMSIPETSRPRGTFTACGCSAAVTPG